MLILVPQCRRLHSLQWLHRVGTRLRRGIRALTAPQVVRRRLVGIQPLTHLSRRLHPQHRLLRMNSSTKQPYWPSLMTSKSRPRAEFPQLLRQQIQWHTPQFLHTQTSRRWEIFKFSCTAQTIPALDSRRSSTCGNAQHAATPTISMCVICAQ